MRYFAELAYNGKNYYGWQRQPDQKSVQEVLEDAFSLILRTTIEITGCGRTDTGVHASKYFIHFDYAEKFPKELLRRLNKFLPPDIVLYRIFEVAPEAHARYDAHYRSYAYHLDFLKNPFAEHTSYLFPFAEKLDIDALQHAAELLLSFEEFFPFCKTHTDAKTMRCELFRSEWEWREEEQKLVYHIAANRFLRGMVRLIVGMCLNVGLGKLSLEKVRQTLEKQERLQQSWSVPPDGLFLTDVRYPFLEE